MTQTNSVKRHGRFGRRCGPGTCEGPAAKSLFLMADDHARYVLRCEGNSRAITPNLDRLACGRNAVRTALLQFARLHSVEAMYSDRAATPFGRSHCTQYAAFRR